MIAGTISFILTVCIFGAVGWAIASRRSRPAGPVLIAGLIVAAVLGYYVGVGTILIGVGDFQIRLNWALLAGCLGACLALIVRRIGLRGLEHGPS